MARFASDLLIVTAVVGSMLYVHPIVGVAIAILIGLAYLIGFVLVGLENCVEPNWWIWYCPQEGCFWCTDRRVWHPKLSNEAFVVHSFTANTIDEAQAYYWIWVGLKLGKPAAE